MSNFGHTSVYRSLGVLLITVMINNYGTIIRCNSLFSVLYTYMFWILAVTPEEHLLSFPLYRLRNWDREVKQFIQVYEAIKQRSQDFNILVFFLFLLIDKQHINWRKWDIFVFKEMASFDSHRLMLRDWIHKYDSKIRKS